MRIPYGRTATLRAAAVVGALTVVLLLAVPQVSVAYDAAAACAYARKYYNKVCSDGYFYLTSSRPESRGAGAALPSTPYGHDCAHFVSCCIGGEPHEMGGGLDVPKRPTGYSDYGEPGAANLISWLLGHGAQRKAAIDDLAPGDVIGYDRDGNGSIDHVALYLGDNRVAAHSQSWLGKWQLVYSSGFTFVHIPSSMGGSALVRTATVLVMDVSGSMGQSWQGGIKIESAKKAATNFIELVEQENKAIGTGHWIGIVGFSSSA